jgi:hypothetical protein
MEVAGGPPAGATGRVHTKALGGPGCGLGLCSRRRAMARVRARARAEALLTFSQSLAHVDT